jgi:hypothetical protein
MMASAQLQGITRPMIVTRKLPCFAQSSVRKESRIRSESEEKTQFNMVSVFRS